MELFDTIHCEYPLPEPRYGACVFETRSLERLRHVYTITAEGRLIRHASGGLIKDIEFPFQGDVEMQALDPFDEQRVVRYHVRFSAGCVDFIHARHGPIAAFARPASPLAETQALEARLLAQLRHHRPRLSGLLASASDHWGLEDPLYRFYRQSFKVYYLQEQTRAIVRELAALLPGQPLHLYLLQILEQGTGKQFRYEDNTRWPETTRPIVEAFFHARFFLEMAVRYGSLDVPPRLPPSGYAALLTLYGLR